MYLLVILCVFVIETCAQRGLLVNTTQGWIRGTVGSDGNYFAFYGIPYGGTTAGENRFKAPTPPPTFFDEAFDAYDNSVLCVQPSLYGPIGVEDCLRLNVFTTSVSSSKPVVVWLIGEEYITSNPLRYSFRKFVEKDLVVISLNYRLSIFGFLCLGVSEAPGNAGLKDVVQGLKWIRDNIAEFGGDPNNVALIGHGTAAAMVDLVTMSPLAHNLVHKVMVHSGSALAPWAVAHDPIRSAQIFATKIGFEGSERKEIAEFLKTSTINSLIDTLIKIELLDNTYPFAPCIENVNLNPSDTFLFDAPLNLLRSGNYNHVFHISGYTDKEGTIRLERALLNQWLEKMQSNFTNFLPVDLNIDAVVEASIHQLYFEDRNLDLNNIDDYMKYHGDTMIIMPVIRGTVERRQTSRAEVRLLEFTYLRTNNSDWAYPSIPLTGVPHGGVLNFLLDIHLGSRDVLVMDSLVNRYVAFSYTGVPTVVNRDIHWWHMSNSTSRRYFSYSGGNVTDPGPVVWRFLQAQRHNPYQEKMQFWDDIYSRYYVPPRASSAVKTIDLMLIVLFSQTVILL